MPCEPTHFHFLISARDAGSRLDRFVTKNCPELSRTRVQELIHSGLVLLNEKPAKDSQKVHTGDKIEVVPEPSAIMLLGFGGVALGACLRRRGK